MSMSLKHAKLYKTAYSPLFKVFVKINRVYPDERGKLIFECSSTYQAGCHLYNQLFREEELTRFCL